MTSGRVRNIAIIGGGITGLAAAHRIITSEPTATVTLFEGSSRLGGIIRTERRDGWLLELGPDSFITNKPGGVQLCADCGFTDQLIPTDNTFRRSLVLHQGAPEAVPDGFMLMAPSNHRAIIDTPVLSFAGSLRLLAEASIPPRGDVDDETLASFVTRRFGREALERLVQPLVGGIYASDPDKLSLRATLPRFLDMEAEFGSVINATKQQKQARGPDIDSSGSGARYGLFTTPRDGLSSLVDHLADQIAAHPTATLCLNQKIESVQPAGSCWNVVLTGENPPQSFDEVIMTLPAYRVAELICDPHQSELRDLLAGIEYASSAIVVTGHSLSDFAHPLDAFGLVVPLVEQRRILATSFTSRKFPNRAPAGRILLRTFVGGAMQPELLDADDSEIQQLVNEELKEILGMRKPPEFSEVVRYQRAMPQYHVGHQQRVDRIERLIGNTAGLHVAGSAYRGVGIPDSIASGRAAADAALTPAAET
ncbi:MAG: protoporphyrinogen oxidase [Planctomycetaceae bacterium]|nr:protoporphyrinogen oxidase [Planctomycetaceae bacterium]